jgi:ATP-binding cassette subfamily C protein CydD
VLRIAFISSAGLEFFAALSVALVAVYAGFNLLGLLPAVITPFHFGHISLARAVFVLALAPEFYAPMRRLAAAYHDRQAAETVADGLMALEQMPPPPRAAAAPLQAPPQIRFEHVTVRYPGEEHAALADVSFDIAPGEVVALLGPSGAGKTTALNLLLGLAEPAAGRVTINGTPLAEFGGLSASVAWMGQAPLLMAGTIAEAIALARPEATRDEILAAATEAGLGPMLAARPAGLDTWLDERGSGLSGGERQRLALARMLLKPARLILMDEPTAHLDELAEKKLIQIIAHQISGRTTLMATHSLSLASIAHRIIRLEARA